MVSVKNKFVETSSHTDWNRWCRSLLDLYTTKKQFLYEDIHKISHNRMSEWIRAHDMSGVQLILRNLLLDGVMSAESQSSGAGSYVPWFLYNNSDTLCVRKSSKDYMLSAIACSQSDVAKEIFRNIYDNVGPLTKIIVKDSYEYDPVIKYRNSFCFPLTIDPQFHRIIGHVDTIEQTNPIVIMIEGAPETIGEINSLLEWNHSEKRPVILVARSFPEEISATLASNWLRNSLSVLPMTYGTSIESINLAADLCAVAENELISPHFGDIVPSSIMNRDKWGSIDRAEWTQTGLYMYKNVDVSGHVNNIISKLKNTESEDLQVIYRDRILSLSNDAIEIWINKADTDVNKELDSIIKHFNGFVVSGSTELPIGDIPYCFAQAAKDSADSLKEKILNIGGFLVGVKNAEMVSSG